MRHMAGYSRPHRRMHADPAHIYWAVRRKDGRWLARPEIPGQDNSSANSEAWSCVLARTWQFDSEKDARAAARSHGCHSDDCTLVTVPRKGGDWLKLEGAWAA